MPTGYYIGQAIPPAPVAAPEPGAASQFGLFSAARMLDSPPRHELNGVEYEPVCSTRVDEWPLNCTPYRGAEDGQGVHEGARDQDPMPWPKGRDEGPRWPYGRKLFEQTKGITSALPFGVYAGEDCFLGNHDQSEALANLRERFRLGEERTVERVIYDGLFGVTPAIRDRPLVLTTGGITADGKHDKPIPPLDGVGLLEHWLACDSGALGVIHMPRFMGGFFSGGEALRQSGPRARSGLGHTFVFGAGYSGDAPYDENGELHDEVPDKVWLYATRPVTVRRSSLLQPADYEHGGFSMPRNEASLLMERVYVVDWPCEVAAVQVDFPKYRLDAVPAGTEVPVPPDPPEPPPPGEDDENKNKGQPNIGGDR